MTPSLGSAPGIASPTDALKIKWTRTKSHSVGRWPRHPVRLRSAVLCNASECSAALCPAPPPLLEASQFC